MFINYLKIAIRNIRKNKLYSALNIIGLSSGIAVALLIGLWVFDEINFNRYNRHYDDIAIVQKNRTYNGSVNTETSNPFPLAVKLRETYGSDFDEVVTSSYGGERTLQYQETAVIKRGYFMEDGGEKILDLQITRGNVQFPLDPSSLLISESVARSLFGNDNPLDKIITIDNKKALKIAGVYRNIPNNSTFRAVHFYASFETYAQLDEWVQEAKTSWEDNSLPIYVKMAPGVSMDAVSEKIKNTTYEITKDESKPELFLFAMSKWHLYPEFKNGAPVGIGLQNLWIFGMIGIFVLLLAAINFMNLSTARSEKRAKEIGIRKSIGSARGQLIRQFYTETFLTVGIAGALGILIARLALPWFNEIAEKNMAFLWTSPQYWGPLAAFLIITGIIAGSYPALYLSSFQPLSVLKGRFKTGFREIFSRKVLVVFQFSISVILIISTAIIIQQIQFAKNRPIGYETSGLIQFQKRSPLLRGHFYAMRQDLLDSGAVVEMAESNGPVTEIWNTHSGFQWRGKDPNLTEDLITLRVTPEFGKTIGWEVKQGRDFSRTFSTDSSAIILNEAAAKMMGFTEPVQEMIRYEGTDYVVIGVTKDIVMESPYEPVKPTIFTMKSANMHFVSIKLNPLLSASTAVAKVEEVLTKYDPSGNFNIKFLDAGFGKKFWREERMAKLATAFSAMAVFISLLGIFGLAAFIAEQRTKEIGVRKVLGASVFQMWRLLSKDFMALVITAIVIATPVVWHFMGRWLDQYAYRTTISWRLFLWSGLGAFILTLVTVSFQSVKAALMNPVKSLRSE